MKDYEGYLKQLKGTAPGFDDEKMYSGIRKKIARRSYARRTLAGFSLAILFIIAFYIGSHPGLFSGSETLADYIFQQKDVNGDSIMSYVFSE